MDEGETDPCNRDTDGDKIQDGTEKGLTLDDINNIPAKYVAILLADTDTDIFQPDEDPSTTTDATCADTDSDGITDGDEDTNQNGKFEEGETNPLFLPHKTDIDGYGDIDGLDIFAFF